MMLARCSFSMRKIASTVALIGFSTQAGAMLVADGKLGDSAPASIHGTAAAALAEGYTSGWVIGFNDDQGNLIGNGQLWFGTDSAGAQYLYFLLPTDYVDNTYGTNASAGWGAGGHTFKDLLNSDSLGALPNFEWVDKNTGTTNAARIDYIADCAAGAGCNVAGFKSGGVGNTGTGIGAAGTNGGGAKWTQVDATLTGSAASILEIATSLEYNLQNVDPTATTNSSLNANWLKEVGYELKFAAGTFDAATWNNPNLVLSGGEVTVPGAFTLGDPHVSPSMKTFGGYLPPNCIPTSNGACAAPIPATPWLLGLAFAGMGYFARRQKRRDATGGPPPI